MPRYTVGTGSDSLPKRTREYLANGASVGSRHNELFLASCQFRDAGFNLKEAARQCVARAVKDGLDEAEAAKTVASAFRHEPRQSAVRAIFGGASKRQQGQAGAKPREAEHAAPLLR